MDIRSALVEMSDLLSVASQALKRIAEGDVSSVPVCGRFSTEIEAISQRLRELSEQAQGEMEAFLPRQ